MKRKALYLAVIFIAAAAIAIAGFVSFKKSGNDGNGNGFVVPQKPVHWHPKLKIIINGEEQPIPPDIGISIGNNIDNHISGMKMSPIHTHESDGTLHIESSKPWLKPETLTLGYFFRVWGKNFSSSCIFEYCNGASGSIKMTVNDKENFEFEKYFMHDKDEIVIRYE